MLTHLLDLGAHYSSYPSPLGVEVLFCPDPRAEEGAVELKVRRLVSITLVSWISPVQTSASSSGTVLPSCIKCFCEM